MPIDSGAHKYIVPRGDGTGEPLILDVAAVVKAEARLADVAIVNTQNAAELLATFNDHWLTLQRNVTVLTYEKNKAEDTLRRTKAEALLDCNDEKLRARGHTKSSADLREALVELEPRVVAAYDRINEIRAVLEFMRGKMQGFENGYNSVKKLVATTQLPPQKLNYGAEDPFGDKKKQVNLPPDDPFEGIDLGDNKDEVGFDEPAMPAGFEEPSYGRRDRR